MRVPQWSSAPRRAQAELLFGVMRGQSQEKNSRALLSMISTIQFQHRGKRKNTSVDILLHCVLVKGSLALAADSILQRLDGRSEKKRK
jgi:hypothetical protein